MVARDPHELLEERATNRRDDSPCGIGAALGRELTERDRDGRLWECVITDTIDGFRTIQVIAPRVPHDWDIPPGDAERQVEQAACAIPDGPGRLDAFADRSPIRVELFLERDG